VRTVGYSSGTGYLCQRDTLGRMRGLLGESRKASGMGFVIDPQILSIAGGVAGSILGVGTQIWAANVAAEKAKVQSQLESSQALRNAGLAAQQQAYQSTQTDTTVKTAAITAGAVAAVGLAVFLIWRMRRS
jgi:hypothetical protein